jgi:DNA-binding beta-propeller fold protein YncE
MRSKLIFSSLAVSTVLVAAGYHVANKVAIGGDGGWDYVTVDPDARRVYVSHATEVDVLDADSGAIVGKIAELKGVHGIAIAPEFSRGFISNGQSGTITIFDTKTLKKVNDELPAGKNPDSIVYDPATQRIFAFNGGNSSATVIDAELGSIVGTVTLQGKPEFAAADGANAMYVNIEDKSAIARIDTRKLLVEQVWKLAPCEEPSGMAMDRASRRLFVGCGNKLMAVVNADSGKIVSTLPICSGVDASAFDPDTKLIFHSCGDGNVTVFHEDSPDQYTAQEPVQTRAGSRTMAVDTKTHKLFLPTADFEPESTQPAQEGQRARRKMLPGTFGVLVVEQ